MSSSEDDARREAQIAAWFAGVAERVIETSCARVYLAGELAWKIKRPVNFGFLDYSTGEKRFWALQRELSFNRAAAPDIYRRVVALTRAVGGGLELDGPGEVVEHALEMRRFDETAVLAEQPWTVDGTLAETLGRTVARYHAGAPVQRQSEGGGGMSYTIRSNAEVLRGLGERLDGERVEALAAATFAAAERLKPLLEERVADGYVRRCHGDLHLGNVLLENGAPVLFDCIEFNDALSQIDVLYDIAFLLMDLDFRRRRDAAVRVLSGWLDESARPMKGGGEDDSLWRGLAVLPLALSVRAAVRCHVQAYAGDLEAADAYLSVALAHLEPPPPALAAVGGLSGSGKSTFARLAAPGLGASPGAVVLRSDEIRKRLWGVGPLEALPSEAYAPGTSEPVYARMFHEAELCLKAGRAVVLDAVFLKAEERAQAAALAARLNLPFEGVWLDAPADVLRARVQGRSGDASDADVATLESQLRRDPGPMDWRILDARAPLDDQARALVDAMVSSLHAPKAT
ncbi:aminoglycoside phosphotransferase family enzyme/predicted kinase [Caulobacter ginsengisoli]|uniref:Aminoglycoside phosphotransferase family enzyme/predicted kinase n=1 Tax=Caulobacter ginsengisoli TaxID=400775 RepID=A0ABU0IN59_9CAUL|nr:AAA family ATPase [Caulobacter ginsengisoli]MDQ0463450.1 aminoglycoside phosphotransferase family enzyme/predicted kinase [Caulobacter ginsengisoli]